MNTPTPRPGRGWTSLLFLAVVLALTFALASALTDGQTVLAAWGLFTPSAFGWALCAVLGNYALRLARWELYLRKLEIHVEARLSALVFCSGFVMSVSPGKLGEVLKSALLYKHRGIPIEHTAPIVLTERLLDLVALTLLVTIASGALPGGGWVALAGALLVGSIFALCLWRGLFEWLLRSLGRVAAAAPLVPRLREAYASLQVLVRPGPWLWGTALTTAGWSLECVATLWILRGFEGVHLDWIAATFSYSTGTLAGALAMLPGGLGVTELGMGGLLVATTATLEPEVAMVGTLLVRFATLWFGVLLGGLAWTILEVVFKREPQ